MIYRHGVWSNCSTKAGSFFLTSVADKRSKEVAIANFDAITTGKKSDALRPTLFDFLAHRAIDRFSNERTYVNQPAYKFYIDQEEALAPIDVFVKTTFESKEKDAPKYQALLLFQELLTFHQDEKHVTALVDADLKRLKYVHRHAILEDKDASYLKALQSLEQKYSNHTSVTESAVLPCKVLF